MLVPVSYNIRNLVVRRTTTLMTALGVGLTVSVLVGIGTLVEGLRTSLEVGGDPLNLIVMRQGSTAELVSVVSREDFEQLKFAPGIATDGGEPLISHEVLTVVNLPLRADPESVSNITLRGLSPVGTRMRPGVRLTEGRWFETGRREVTVGTAVNAKRAGTSVGDMLYFGRGDWEVVGVFETDQGAFNSEIWADGNLAAADLGRGSMRSSILIRAQDEAAAKALTGLVADDQRLTLEAERESEYYAKQMVSAGPVQGLGALIAVIMAVGSCFAAMNTMFAAVANRAREVGILRLLGFSRVSILTSFMLESLLLSVVGGLLGCLMVAPLHGFEGRIGNFTTFAETSFQFQLTPQYVVGGMVFAAVMGVVGGFIPSWLAARKSVLGSLGAL
ncbi:MAG: ABC transporter permease [Bryobacterales bacterium]|nr:ABC transporter permease [Bryobacterales bacterium]